MIVGVQPMAGFDKVLHYRVPESLRADVQPGSLVRVPIVNRQKLAIVVEVDAIPDCAPQKLKLVTDALHAFPALTPDLLALAKWMHAYYAARMESVFEAMIPAAVRGEANVKEEKYLSLARALTTEELAALRKKAPQQARLCEFLLQQFTPAKKSLVLSRLDCTAAVVTALIKRGFVREEVRHVERVAYADSLSSGGEVVTGLPPKLNEEQAAAVDSMHTSLAREKFAVHLLHGVTGSGKTEVYLRAVEEVLAAGGSAIYLVPEVALTPQTVSRLRGRFEAAGHQTVVWHSHLSEGERLDGWQALASGQARVVVGARSAVFAPTRRLGLIVIDEEHESTFKQETVPRYHARDVAVMRGRLEGVPVLLGSATPALESWRNSEVGRYSRLSMLERVGNRPMPEVQLIDLRNEKFANVGLSPPLRHAMTEALDQRGQVILLLNRRGFHTYAVCISRECGKVLMCESCDIAMTYHKQRRILICHTCDAERGHCPNCPACGSKLYYGGIGTEQLEREVFQEFPDQVIRRMDSDTMRRPGSHEAVLSAFKAGEVDILLGTQMIAKGLDFPNVTLVGVIDADTALHMPDFRAAERTFQLVAQVAGRTGRGDRVGKVLVQTRSPENPAIACAVHHDYKGFVESELIEREGRGLPPFGRLVRVVARGGVEATVKHYMDELAAALRAVAPSSVKILGPAPAPVLKIRDLFRHHLRLTAPSPKPLHDLLKRGPREVAIPPGVELAIDVDPVSML